MSTAAVAGVTRGCGKRQRGGIYLEVAASPFGRPIDDFLQCPPTSVNASVLGLSPIGVRLLEDRRTGEPTLWHVFDWVGSDSYPNVQDFIEEARLLGVSRRVARILEFDKLSPRSRLLLLHARASIHDDSLESYHDERVWPRCPANQSHGEEYRGMCCGLFREDLEHADQIITPEGERQLKTTQPELAIWFSNERQRRRMGLRTMPWGDYLGARPPFHPVPPNPDNYDLAIFASLPIGRIVVVKNPDERRQENAAYKLASASSLPVEKVEE